ncbi:MAG: twin-arginine translocase subunit TatC [Bacillota bacterium]|nr:twin-arginine translocase subunit TatC [Bacillota bacterium]
MKARRNKKHTDELTLIGHLDELRWRLVVCGLALAGGVAVGFFFAAVLQDFLLHVPGDLVYLAPGEAFFTHLRLAVTIGLVLAAPMVLSQAAAFIAPGLTDGEKKYLYIGLPAAMLLFVSGVFFAYKVMLPLTYAFFLGFGSDRLTAMISVGSYISFVLGLVIPFGVVFQLPLLVMILTGVGLVTPYFFKSNRKYAVLVIFILAALLTPPDLISQMLMAGPLLLLYEFSVFMAALVYRRRTVLN